MERVDDAEGQKCWLAVPFGSLIVLQDFFPSSTDSGCLCFRSWLEGCFFYLGQRAGICFVEYRMFWSHSFGSLQYMGTWGSSPASCHPDGLRLKAGEGPMFTLCLLPLLWVAKTFVSDLKSDVSTSIHVSRSWRVCSYTVSKSLPLYSSS